ncbi:hypothetical protein ENUP19_0082G0123 [Entamoeba nuttalli]|uniref:Thioredoxin, putative n=2 Tax=Entamoeba nuttalli TaxID=412467 RepID=K2HZE1_ENTNP|nr:thioredoxin, putative [Entamoeba nuttalli P19]EKE41800.1 thioredoxin, putative [Entamoeba nuttalli P19]|eukprot:XP_008855865.1 thioredoxin, putative [Entamoeba nuttalli P19]
MTIPLNTTNLEELKEKTATGVAVVQFHATWCKDCINVRPLYRKLITEAPTTTYLDIDIDKAPELKKIYNIVHVPTFILYHNGQELKRIVEPGYDELESFMDEASKL